MKFQYEATFRIDMGQAILAVGELLEGINTHLSKDGYDERIKCHASIGSMLVTADRELTESEQYKVRTIIEAQIIESMPKYDVRLVDFRRKPGNVSQSAL
jgi:hypothetical protein